MKKVFIATVVVISVTGCVDRQAQQQAKQTQEFLADKSKLVTVVNLAPTSISETLEITGNIVTGDDTTVGAKQSGRLVSVFVKDGDAVSAGQVVAQQENTTQMAQLSGALASASAARSQVSQAEQNARILPSKSAAAVNQAQAQLRSAKANLQKVVSGARPEERSMAESQVKSAKNAMDTAKSDYDRKLNLFNQGAIPRTQLEQSQNAFVAAQTAYNNALQNNLMIVNGARTEDVSVAREAVRTAQDNLNNALAQQKLDVLYNEQVQAARSNLLAVQSQVAVAQQAVADTQIRAPFDGTISGRPTQIGSMLSPGAAVVHIVGKAGVYFEGEIPEDKLPKVVVGNPVNVQIASLGTTAQGIIAAVSPEAQQVGRLFKVRIQLTSPSSEIKPGMFARGVINVKTIQYTTVVPTSAVITKGEDKFVFVADKNVAKMRKVQVGVVNGDKSQISGIDLGTPVIVTGQGGLTEGDAIKVQGSATSTTGQTKPAPALQGGTQSATGLSGDGKAASTDAKG